MEYLVLARKWRPQVFEEVLGQEPVVRTLANAITQERIAHAFLFSGPRGVGKTSIARILAKALNCEQGPTPVPCGRCSHCLEITAGNAIDVREIDGASNNGVEEIRQLRENVKFAPVSCRYKIYIIDEVHMLSTAAFNALLKTLEEPPGHVAFVFATTETNKVPATILSRCQCFEFRRIPLKLIAENLRKIAVADGISISDAALSWIAEAGDGSLRDSQSIFDQVISYAGREIADAAVEEVLGRSDRRFLFPLSGAVLARNAGQCLKIIDEAYAAGLDLKFFAQSLLTHFRNLLFAGIPGGEAALTDLPADELAKLKAQAAAVPRENLQRYLEFLIGEEEALRRSQNPRLNLEAVLCRMAYLEPLLPIDEVLARMEGLERRLAASGPPPGGLPPGEAAAGRPPERHNAPSAGIPAAQAPGKSGREDGEIPPAGAAAAASRSSGARGDWKGFKGFLKRHNPALCAKIEPGHCLDCREGALRIGFGKGYLFRDDVEAGKAPLEALAQQFFGCAMAVTFETLAGEGNGANGNGNGKSERAAKALKLQEARREVLSHPVLLKVLDVFPRAEVRDVRLREAPEAGAAPAPPPAEDMPLPPDGEEPPLPDEPYDE